MTRPERTSSEYDVHPNSVYGKATQEERQEINRAKKQETLDQRHLDQWARRGFNDATDDRKSDSTQHADSEPLTDNDTA